MRVLLLSIAFIGLLVGFSVAKEDRPSCEKCGMFWDISPARSEVSVIDGASTNTHLYENFNCAYKDLTSQYGDDVVPSKLEVVDYQTFNSKHPEMIDAFEATFLYGTKRMKATMPPFIAAFSSEKDAKAAQKVIGGDLLDSFDSVWKRLTKHNSPDGDSKQAGAASAQGGCGDDCSCGK